MSAPNPSLNGGKRHWLVLGAAVLGLTSSVTVLAMFLPLVIADLTTSRLAIGFAVGVEGLVALTIPLLVGQASDQTWNRLGRRLPYMLAATPLVIGGLVAIAFLDTYWLIVGSVFAYFVGYYAYYTAYQALYPDTLPEEEYGRAWAYQSIFQGIGVAMALLGGGILLGWSVGAPFLAAAAVFAVVAGASALVIKERPQSIKAAKHWRHAGRTFWKRLREDPRLRWFMVSHFFWEFTVAAIRAFVLLYLLRGLGAELGELLPLLIVIILVYLLATVISGYVADAFDPRNYTTWVIATYAVALIATGFLTEPAYLEPLVPFGMFAGAAVMMLSYPILLRVTPAERRGEYTGYYQFNRGLALLLGTSATGMAIDTFGRYFPATDGYQVLWLVCGAAALLSIPPFLALTRRSDDAV